MSAAEKLVDELAPKTLVHLPIVGQEETQPSRYAERRTRKRDVRARTESMQRLSKRKLAAGTVIADLELSDMDITRPKTRADCEGGPRPCPWVSCKHNLFLDVDQETHAVKLNFPDVESGASEWSTLAATCALDVSDEGGATLERVGEILNLTRERIRQVETKALTRVQKRASRTPLADFKTDYDADQPVTIRVGHADGGQAPPAAQPIEPDETEDAEPETVPQKVWDMSYDDTPVRLEAAQRRAYAAYVNKLITRGLITATRHERADEILAEVEQNLANQKVEEAMKSKAEKTEERRESILADLDKHQPTNGASIARRLKLKSPAVGIVLRKLAEEDLVVSNGKRGKGALYAKSGFDFEAHASAEASTPAPRVSKSAMVLDVAKKTRARKVLVRVATPTSPPTKTERVLDLNGDSAAPWTVRFLGVPIECGNPNAVIWLCQAIAGAQGLSDA